MELNSVIFVAFFAVVFLLYYLFSQKCKVQNIILLAASYFFYGYVNWKILPIIVLMTLFFYVMGLQIGKCNGRGDEKTCSRWTVFTIVVGLLPLLYFKYFAFFVSSFAELFAHLGFVADIPTLRIILPLGISFYTFRLLSYAIEVYQEGMSAEKNLLDFATYVAFFPSLMAGPIDRPNVFLPQIKTNRVSNYDNLVEGLRRFVWGWFMKVCIADRIAAFIDPVVANYSSTNSTTILLMILLYPLQMYADFGGYSNMAIGVSKMLGIVQAENFKRPLFSLNIAELWRRWHMSLTSWLTDYVYTPLAFQFRNWGKWGIMLAITINMVLIGFWHGPDWSFGFFGLYQAMLYIPLVVRGNVASGGAIHWKSGFIPWKELWKIVLTFLLFSIGMVFSRADNLTDSFGILHGLFKDWGMPHLGDIINWIVFMPCLLVLFIKDWIDERGINDTIWRNNKPVVVVILVTILIIAIFVLRGTVSKEFIYMQF